MTFQSDLPRHSGRRDNFDDGKLESQKLESLWWTVMVSLLDISWSLGRRIPLWNTLQPCWGVKYSQSPQRGSSAVPDICSKGGASHPRMPSSLTGTFRVWVIWPVLDAYLCIRIIAKNNAYVWQNDSHPWFPFADIWWVAKFKSHLWSSSFSNMLKCFTL